MLFRSAPFSQVVFHALFYSDFYLDESEALFKAQPFHVLHKAVFADYEELENRMPVGRYDKEFCVEYLLHSLAKVRRYFLDKNEEWLLSASPQHGKIKTRLELFVYTLRHIQHHAAQLGLRLQYLSKREMPWFRSGWTV